MMIRKFPLLLTATALITLAACDRGAEEAAAIDEAVNAPLPEAPVDAPVDRAPAEGTASDGSGPTTGTQTPATPAKPVTGERLVDCRISNDTGGTLFDAHCLFVPQSNGGFTLMRPRGDEQPLYAEVLSVSVSKTSATDAEVRGLTGSGVNSRWGAATRSQDDPACWTGTDFEVCAY